MSINSIKHHNSYNEVHERVHADCSTHRSLQFIEHMSESRYGSAQVSDIQVAVRIHLLLKVEGDFLSHLVGTQFQKQE